jgi:putative hydrolase of the HAD superfamily
MARGMPPPWQQDRREPTMRRIDRTREHLVRQTPMMPARSIDAVIFDLGGVLSRTGKPSDLSGRFPGHDPKTVIRILMGDYGTDGDHPWHRLERGEMTLEENRRLNREAFAAAGIDVPPPEPGPQSSLRFEPNVAVIDLVHELRSAGLRLGVLTNNVLEFRQMWWPMMDFDVIFDDVVDSHEVAMRKPDPAIYRLALDRLGAVAARTAFLDDVQSNIDAADAVGMRGILVDDDPSSAVQTVRTLAGLMT